MKKTKLYIALLLAINVVVYHHWLSFSVFTYSDWIYYFRETLSDRLIPTVWSPFLTITFGSVDILLWKLPLYFIMGLIGNLGYDFNIADKIIIFWPIIFGLGLSSFFLVRHITKSNLAAFVGSIVFSYNTYFLGINSQGHQFLPASFLFATLTILIYIRLLEEKKLFLLILSSIFLLITSVYDLRCLYITLGLLFLYFVYFVYVNYRNVKKELIRYCLYGCLPVLILGVLSFYWVVPIFLTGYVGESSLLGRQIFGNEVFSIQSSITTFFPFWTGKETAWFAAQPIPFYYWLYPVMAILGFVLTKKNINVTFFALVSLIGIFLSKQADVPFTQIYSWLYFNFPGFNAFREATKFNYLTAIGFAVLIGALTKWLYDQKWGSKLSYLKYVITVLIVIITLSNGKPIFTGEIKQLYTPRQLSNDYVDVKNYILNQQDYFRTFWINMSLSWAAFNNIHPQIDGAVMFNSSWNKYYKNNLTDKKYTEGEKLIKYLQSENTNKLLDLSSVKYVGVPLEDKNTQSDIVKYFGKTHDFYRKEMNKISYLKKVDNMPNNILLYENSDYRSHLYLTSSEEQLDMEIPYKNIESLLISPSEYEVTINNLKEKVWINFTENYHPGWKLRVGDFNWLDAITNSNYFLTDKLHKKNVMGFNSFYFDPQEVCKLESCKKNKDGSYNLKLTLYFKSQSYLYLGMIISGSVLLFLVSYLFYYGFSKKRK